MTITVSSELHKQFFMSKKHGVPEGLDNSWVPVSYYTKTREEVVKIEKSFGYTEVKHPVESLQG